MDVVEEDGLVLGLGEDVRLELVDADVDGTGEGSPRLTSGGFSVSDVTLLGGVEIADVCEIDSGETAAALDFLRSNSAMASAGLFDNAAFVRLSRSVYL